MKKQAKKSPASVKPVKADLACFSIAPEQRQMLHALKESYGLSAEDVARFGFVHWLETLYEDMQNREREGHVISVLTWLRENQQGGVR